MGLPRWQALVEACAHAAALPDTITGSPTSDALMKIVEKIESKFTKPEFFRVIRENLYKDCKDDRDLLSQRLLAVVGAMTMSSRRGRISEVLTFNFDDILERYLALHGFVSQVVVDLPTLRRDADVTIYHPHGFLPSPRTRRGDSQEIIFSAYSFDKRMGTRLDPWQDLLNDIIRRKVGLIVGLSDNSLTLQSVLAATAESLKSAHRPTAFWLLGSDDPTDVDDRLLHRNVVPVRLGSYDEFPLFLLKVCQFAAVDL
jgi:hypothetical protein